MGPIVNHLGKALVDSLHPPALAACAKHAPVQHPTLRLSSSVHACFRHPSCGLWHPRVYLFLSSSRDDEKLSQLYIHVPKIGLLQCAALAKASRCMPLLRLSRVSFFSMYAKEQSHIHAGCCSCFQIGQHRWADCWQDHTMRIVK